MEPGIDASTYKHLLRHAKAILSRESFRHPWEPADLVHEMFLRMARSVALPQFTDRNHFLTVARIMMRRILIDYARANRNSTRFGQVDFESEPYTTAPASFEAMALYEVLQKMAIEEERLHRMVELRFFFGLQLAEIAAAL